jgi:tetratricopeptide (TPR) repeat protein
MQALYHVEAAARAGWSPDLLRLAGDLWQEAGSEAQALPYWQAAAAARPGDTTLLRQIAQTSITQARWPDAADALERLLVAVPDDVWAHYQLGLIRAAYDPAAARVHLQVAAPTGGDPVVDALLAALDAPDESAPLGMRVGQALMSARLWGNAELAFRQAAAERAPYADALAYAALARLPQGKDAGTWAAQAVLLAPDSALAHYASGLSLRAAGDLAASRDALARAVTLAPTDPVYYAELGSLYQLSGDLAEAARWLTMAVSVSGGDELYQKALALFYAETGYPPPNAAALLTDDPDVRAQTAWALHLAGDTDAALAELDAVLAQASDSASALFYKAQIILARGDDRAAAAALLAQVAAQDSPFSVEARRILAHLAGE